MDISAHIRSVPDFPKPGIVFIDITTLIGNPEAFRWTVDGLCDAFAGEKLNAIAAAEARGFIFASAMAYKLGLPLVPMRKPGKLPWKTASASYQLEYGTAELHMHVDALNPGDRVLLVDDLLATGGTAKAMAELVEGAGGVAAGVACVVELAFLRPRDKLAGLRVESLTRIESEG